MWIVQKRKYLELKKENERLISERCGLRDEISILRKQDDENKRKINDVIKYSEDITNKNAKYINENAVMKKELSDTRNNADSWFNFSRRKSNELKVCRKRCNEIELENKRLKIKSNTLKKLVLRKDAEIRGIGKAFNVLNNRLWCNEESKRQIRKLSNDLLNGEKIPHKDLGIALRDISMYMGGGEHLKFEDKKGDIE